MVIKRFSTLLGSKRGVNPFSRSNSSDAAAIEEEPTVTHAEDTPEGSVLRGVKAFCEAGGPDNQGEEVLHLPVIVEAAESSPSAAQVAAQTIRKFLSKDNYGRPHVQYNSIMLIRILADNPGATFTRNLDSKFTATVKELLRTGKDPSVQQLMRETLQSLYLEKAYDTNLVTLFAMWSKESGMKMSQASRSAGPGQNGFQGQVGNTSHPQAPMDHFQQGAPRGQRGLPSPVELSARIEEAKTSAKLLQQLVQSTPPNELIDNELIKEFAERCQSAQRSMQGYLNSTPSPDADTMQTLIETSEQLSLAASKHQRAVLQARRAGAGSASPTPQSVYAPPPQPPVNTGYSSPVASPTSTFVPTAVHDLTAYSPPPVPPPNMRQNLDRRITNENITPSSSAPLSSNPPSHSPISPSGAPQLPPIRDGAIEIPAPQYDNPFSDSHASPTHAGPPIPRSNLTIDPVSASSYEDDDDPYRIPSGHPSATTSPGLPVRPAVPVAAESWRAPVAGNPESYHPGFQSTPSYVKRQESSGDKFTMSGATTTIDEERVAESSGRYGKLHEEGLDRVSPVHERTLPTGLRRESSGDISPVESRFDRKDGSSAAKGAGVRY